MTAQQIYYSALATKDVLIPGATSYKELPDQVLEMEQERMRMISFLGNATGPNATKSEANQTHISQVRDVLDDVEDIIDKFRYIENKGRCVVGILSRTSSFTGSVWGRHQITTRIRELKDKLNALPDRLRLYTAADYHPHDGDVVFDSEAALLLDENDLVGIKAAKQKLIGYINRRDLRRTTTSLVGMAGSGKTTLAVILFKSPAVKKFGCRAWITVSRTFNIEQLLRDLIKEINKSTTGEKIDVKDLSEAKYTDLVEKLRDHLENKTYLVVLDDVWASNVWESIKVALPDSKNGSRVILTARREDDVPKKSPETGNEVYEVQPLDDTKAWELFCSRAFSSSNAEACPAKLRGTAEELLEKCKGLPIAIDSIGRLLARKERTPKAWRTTLENLQWELSNNKLPLNSVLLLSYNDLPYYLKRCFLYFALFPEDHKIWCDKLVRLWMAEGFVESGGNGEVSSPEDVGMRYIKELISRNVLQAVSWDMYGDHGKCRMHDLYRDIALQISEMENFCSVYAVGSNSSSESNRGCRRVSIHEASNESEVINEPVVSNPETVAISMEASNEAKAIKATKVIALVKGMERLRSLLLFVKDIPFSLSELGWADHHLLRVMDMENAPVEALSEDIEVLYNLKYLNLSYTKIKSLSDTIEKLWSLESLDVSYTDVESLPSGVVKLENLRHLLAGRLQFGRLLEYHGLKGVQIPSGSDISSLKKLQSLRLVEANEEIVKQLRKMVQLVQLGITNVKGQAQMLDLCSALKNMLRLRWLVVIASTEDEILQMNSLDESSSSSSPLQHLEYFILCGKLNSLPNWIRLLPSLTTIRLVWSRLPVEVDPVMHLQGMNSLRNVWLHNAYLGSELRFISGFKSLRALALANLPTLETLTIGKKVMPDLRIILVRDCPKLKTISKGIRFRTKLKELKLENVPRELVDRIRGPDRANFKHIPLIWCRYKSADGQWITEILNL
ncbi:Disease resistance protein RPM1 [Linum grandiflorum]